MKKTLIALAAVAATSAAFAQSSVTLFGVVDLNIRNEKLGTAKAVTTMSKDGISSSRLGFRGTEDLGGGMSAGFWLEGAIDADTGGTAINFQRRSTVSLMGGFGEVRLGRDFTPTFMNHTVYDPFGTNGVASSTNTFGAIAGLASATTVRSNNTVAYFTPNTLGGFFGQLQYGIKETNADSSASDYLGVRVGYNAGPLSVALATAQEGTGGTPYSLNKNPSRTNIGASYDFGVAKPMLQYTTAKQDGVGKMSSLLLGVTAPLGGGVLKASYVTTGVKGFGFDLGDAKQFGIGYDYNLSKRTAVYGTYATRSVDAGFALIPGATGVAATAGIQKSRAFEVGVRHSF
jgi:predicted porin